MHEQQYYIIITVHNLNTFFIQLFFRLPGRFWDFEKYYDENIISNSKGSM